MTRSTTIHSRLFTIIPVLLLVVALVSNAFGSPARLVTKGPVISGVNPFTGPPTDPMAVQGQWFQNNSTGALEVRPWEFYDNNDVLGAIGYQMIQGHVQNLTFSGPVPGGNITGFQIVATITNDLPGIQPPGNPGRNTHDEFLPASPNYQGTMFDVKMTAEFAFPSQVAVPAATLAAITSGTLPYTTPNYGGQPARIIAQNEDQEAWYCYSNTANIPGGFHVPTFDFGNILPGASATRTLSFLIGGAGLTPAHPLYPQLIAWANSNADVLANRTTDLKIGDWVDVLAQDTGIPYFNPPFQSGNVSVFFDAIPEPSSLTIAALGVLPLLRRKRVM